MKAILSNYKQTPRKVRLIADLIRGKSVPDALAELSSLNKRGGRAFKKLLLSAVANAKTTKNLREENLMIRFVAVTKGVVLKRFMPVARGSAHPIRHRRSHIRLELSEKRIKK